MEENSPLILQNVSRNEEMSLNMPSMLGSDLLTFRTGEVVSFACPDVNDNMFLIQKAPFKERELTAVCKKGKIYFCYQNRTTFSVLIPSNFFVSLEIASRLYKMLGLE
jgi:hypothetical protein